MNEPAAHQTDTHCGHSHNGHDHHSHSHGNVSTADGRRRVAIAGILTGCFMIAEVVGGLVSGSLALLADAAHMLTDAASLGLAWLGYRLAARPASQTHTYGYARMRVLAAFVNGIALLALSVWITIEGIQRLLDPQPVIGELLLGVAIVGLLVNMVCFYILVSGDHEDLNLRSALLHVAGDLLGSIAAIAAASIILITGWMQIDPLLSILVAGLVVVAGWRVTREAGHILTQGAPKHVNIAQIEADLLENISGLATIDHFKIWSLTEKDTIVTIVVTPASDTAPDKLKHALKQRLETIFHVTQATIEIN